MDTPWSHTVWIREVRLYILLDNKYSCLRCDTYTVQPVQNYSQPRLKQYKKTCIYVLFIMLALLHMHYKLKMITRVKLLQTWISMNPVWNSQGLRQRYGGLGFDLTTLETRKTILYLFSLSSALCFWYSDLFSAPWLPTPDQVRQVLMWKEEIKKKSEWLACLFYTYHSWDSVLKKKWSQSIAMKFVLLFVYGCLY